MRGPGDKISKSKQPS